jgi:hypothetical protein
MFKDFNNAAMFTVQDVDVNPSLQAFDSSVPADTSYQLGLKIWKTSVLKEQWYYNDYIGESDPEPKITVKPDEISLDVEDYYTDAYAFVLSSRDDKG